MVVSTKDNGSRANRTDLAGKERRVKSRDDRMRHTGNTKKG